MAMDTTGTIFPPGPELEKLGIPKLGGQFGTPGRDTVLYLHLMSTQAPPSMHHPGAVVHDFLEELERFDDDGEPYFYAGGFSLTEGCTGHDGTPCSVCPGETCCTGWVEYDEPALFAADSGTILDKEWKPVTFAELCAARGLDPSHWKSLSDD